MTMLRYKRKATLQKQGCFVKRRLFRGQTSDLSLLRRGKSLRHTQRRIVLRLLHAVSLEIRFVYRRYRGRWRAPFAKADDA